MRPSGSYSVSAKKRGAKIDASDPASRLQRARWAALALVCLALLPVAAHAETISDPLEDRGRVVVVKPWDTLSEEEKIDQLRSIATARCFSYQRLEQRSGSPVCVESRGR